MSKLSVLHLQDLTAFASLTELRTLCLSVKIVKWAAPPGAVPAMMPALTPFQFIGTSHLPAILAAAAMPALTSLLIDGQGASLDAPEDLDCISCLTALETLRLRTVDLEGSTLHLGALPRLLSLDLDCHNLPRGGSVLRGRTALQTLALDYQVLEHDGEEMMAAVEALPCLRRLSLYADDLVIMTQEFGRLLCLARLHSTLEARGCQIEVVESI